jgi:hypothetical protein
MVKTMHVSYIRLRYRNCLRSIYCLLQQNDCPRLQKENKFIVQKIQNWGNEVTNKFLNYFLFFFNFEFILKKNKLKKKRHFLLIIIFRF